ncbi:3-isopropylmalate dehydrogenase [Niabella sp. CC-SYL272]|uniref:isocitrate/isopropylmalate family dehydrogenase n=1 Tax=Niabella agricola TaxID=2891571 RepID=UPI001F2211C9|nr:isocitrate/isopropylmalate family dehydrogenase [Niabella agricola]MCF3111611.1 3-isopropylmalate dehydrogenase [Niabella agricola]
MKKEITIIEEAGAAGEVAAQAVKVLNAVAEQYDHYFNLTPVTDAIAQPVGDATLFCGYTTQHAIETGLPVLVSVQPVTVYPPLQHLSPLKPRHSEGLNFLLYQVYTAGGQHQDRIIQSALQQAANRRKQITVIADPEDPQPVSWKAALEKAGAAYKGMRIESIAVQEAWDRMLQQPSAFDVIIAARTAGNYLFSQAAAITGARYMIPSVRIAGTMPFFGPAFSFEQAQESTKNLSNPVGAILSVAMMMDYFNLHEEALIIRTAVNWTLLHGFVAKDLDAVNNYSTGTIGDLISDFIRGTIPGFAKGENMALQKSTII